MTAYGRLLGDLNSCGVRYVVVGGIAVISHGVVRATRDVDVVIGTDRVTERAVGELKALWQATRPDGSPEPRTVPTAGWPLHLRTVHGPIDLMAEMAPPLNLAGLLSRADERRVEGTPAFVCGLADLTAMKRMAGRPTDEEDLRRLEAAHGPLPDI